MSRAVKDGWRECFKAPDVLACVTSTAVDLQDPTPILELTEEKEGEVNIYGAKERDILLVMYSQMTLDTDAWALIKDRRLRDGAVLFTAAAAYGRAGLIPKRGYCDNLALGYEYDPDLNHDETVGEEVSSQKDLCQVLMAALREVALDNGECEKVLPKVLEDQYGWGVEDDIDDCKKFVKKIRDGMTVIKEEAGEVRPARWVLAETKVNPSKRPLTKTVGGVVTKVEVSEGRFHSNIRETRMGKLLGDVTWEAQFISPPKVIVPGETVRLQGAGTASGAPWGGIGRPGGGISFYFRQKGMYKDNITSFKFDEKAQQQTFEINFTAGEKSNYNDKMQIRASGSRCGACEIRWIYEMDAGEPNPQLVPVDTEDLDMEQLGVHFQDPTKVSEPETGGGILSKAKSAVWGILGKIKGILMKPFK